MQYILALNDMRSPNIENTTPVAIADSREDLVLWITAQFHGPRDENGERPTWKDGQWVKRFKQGSELEWYNPPYDPAKSDGFFTTLDPNGEIYAPDSFGHGIWELEDIEVEVAEKVEQLTQQLKNDRIQLFGQCIAINGAELGPGVY
jgi:hypothetical protein